MWVLLQRDLTSIKEKIKKELRFLRTFIPKIQGNLERMCGVSYFWIKIELTPMLSSELFIYSKADPVIIGDVENRPRVIFHLWIKSLKKAKAEFNSIITNPTSRKYETN